MVNGTQDNSRVRRGIRVTPGAKAEGSSPGGIRSALDRGANREQGVEKQIPGILQLIHRVYDFSPSGGCRSVSPVTGTTPALSLPTRRAGYEGIAAVVIAQPAGLATQPQPPLVPRGVVFLSTVLLGRLVS